MSDSLGTKARERLMERSRFKTWSRVPVRYNDLDPLGHVNNTAMAIYLEEARCGLITPLLKAHSRHLDMVLATTAMDYRLELTYPGEVEVGTMVTRIGGKSFSLAHGVFQAGRCAGTAELVLVCFDLEKRLSVEPPADVRALLESLRGD
ncbi:MAG: thioesterase family protein [Hyphomicrobiaceae bacterium]|nr:thioesterase family protein [Hyphomicrobiaceae bacterium]